MIMCDRWVDRLDRWVDLCLERWLDRWLCLWLDLCLEDDVRLRGAAMAFMGRRRRLYPDREQRCDQCRWRTQETRLPVHSSLVTQ
jgi:hypothetical protein